MSPTKLRVLMLFGGRSGEHEVSIVSATHVLQALDPEHYDVELIGITHEGRWVQFPAEIPLTELDNPHRQLQPAQIGPSTGQSLQVSSERSPIDVVIPMLHGPYGEDGTIQGFLELVGVPYVGCGVLASAAAMDKVTAKRLFKGAGIPVTDWEMIVKTELAEPGSAIVDRIEQRFSYPMFVKPANLGSSVGVSKAVDGPSLRQALDHAAQFDLKVLVEPAVARAREIEVAVLGNEQPRVSVPGEIVPDREFYDYDAKYGNDSTSEPVIPAKLDGASAQRISRYAQQAFALLDGAGMARVDFLLNGDTGELFLNEVNTIPGFTPISMYTKLWAASGMSYRQLLDELIRLALERASQKQALKTTR